MRALPADAATLAWFEVDSPDRRWPDSELTRPESSHCIDRNGRPGAALLATLADRTFSTEDTAVYITGEAWLCAMTQSHVVRTLGFRPNAVRATPYWKLPPPRRARNAVFEVAPCRGLRAVPRSAFHVPRFGSTPRWLTRIVVVMRL